MIKFIATDMDGTLLDDNKKVDSSIFNIIDYFNKKNIIFCAASGRQYTSLKKVFGKYSDNIMFIAENGAYVVYKDKEIYSNFMKKNLWSDIITKCKLFGGMKLMLNCKKYTYADNIETLNLLSSSKFKYDIKIVNNLLDIKDGVLKISLSVDDVNSHDRGLKIIEDFLIENFNDKTEITVSGFNSIDIVNKNISKGHAMDTIFSNMGIDKKEVIVFGDNFNDIEMFKKAHYSFAMKNSVDKIKQSANFVTEYTNNECGVVKEIIKLSKKGVI